MSEEFLFPSPLAGVGIGVRGPAPNNPSPPAPLPQGERGGRGWCPPLGQTSDIEVADVERRLLDEVAAELDVVAHQHAEDFIRGGRDFL